MNVLYYKSLVSVCELPLHCDRHRAVHRLVGQTDHRVTTRGHALVNPVQFTGITEAMDLSL